MKAASLLQDFSEPLILSNMQENLHEKDRLDGIQSTFKYVVFPNSCDCGTPS